MAQDTALGGVYREVMVKVHVPLRAQARCCHGGLLGMARQLYCAS